MRILNIGKYKRDKLLDSFKQPTPRSFKDFFVVVVLLNLALLDKEA